MNSLLPSTTRHVSSLVLAAGGEARIRLNSSAPTSATRIRAAPMPRGGKLCDSIVAATLLRDPAPFSPNALTGPVRPWSSKALYRADRFRCRVQGSGGVFRGASS